MKRQALDHTKMDLLMRKLNLPRWGAVGILESLWHLTAKEAPRGDIGRLTNERIAIGIEWRGAKNSPPESEADRLIQALVEAGWMEVNGIHRFVIHDWDEHADDSVKKYLKRNNLSFACLDMSRQIGKVPDMARLPVPEPVPLPEPEPNTPKPPAPIGADTEEIHAAPNSSSVVRPALPSEKKQARRGKRTTEEIRRALNGRETWWEEFWKAYPNHDAMNPAMDAYERAVKDHDKAVMLWKGAKVYAAKAAADPTMKLAHGATWIHQERWLDSAPQQPKKAVLIDYDINGKPFTYGGPVDMAK